MVVVGLTGGMGSGKTTVLKMFQELGVSVYIADVEAKRLMADSVELRENIIEQFGINSYNKDKLNRDYLAKIVFNDAKKLKTLNSIVHPAVYKDFKNFVAHSKGQYVLYESAILLHNGGSHFCDYIIIVTAPLAIRIERIIERDATDESEIRKRLQHQKFTQEALLKADFIIKNIALETTEKEVKKIHKQLLLKTETLNK